MNFAEQLSYWYLRLNGFFPLVNFVLHRTGEHQTSDADLLAVRFPHVSEDVGGAESDWDPAFEKWGLPIGKQVIGLIVEVKSGQWGLKNFSGEYVNYKTRYALRRMGILPSGDIDGAVSALTKSPLTEVRGMIFARLLIAASPPKSEVPWLTLDLEAVVQFIQNRMAKYKDPKKADRMMFPDDLIQYFAWRAGVEQ